MTRSKSISPFPSGPTKTTQISFPVLISAAFCPFPSLLQAAEGFLVSNQEYSELLGAFCVYGKVGGSIRSGPKIRFFLQKLIQLHHPFVGNALGSFLGGKVYSLFSPDDSLNLYVVSVRNPV